MSPTRRAAAVLMASTLVVLGGGVAAVSASAGTPGTVAGNGSYVGGKVFAGPEPLVLWTVPGLPGRLGTCIDAGANGPLHGPFRVGSTVTDPVFAELNYLYARSSTSDVRLAELSALNSQKYDQQDKALQYSYVRNGSGGMSVQDANAMVARATNLAGPYTVTIAGLVQHGRGDRAGVTYTATVHVVSANKTPVPGQVVRLSASGATLGSSSVTTDSTGTATFSYVVPTSNTTGSFSVQYSTDQHLVLNRLVSAGEQTLLSTGPATAATGSAVGGVDPSISVTWLKYTAGDPQRTPVAGAVFSSVVDTTAQRTLATNLTSASTPSTLNQVTPGHTLVWTETKAPPGDYFTGPITITVPANATNGYEIALANPKTPTPTISTTAALAQTHTGVALVDRAVLAGDDHEAGTITDQLYSVPVPATGTCTAITDAQYRAGTAVGTYTTEVAPDNGNDGNGTYLITGPAPTTAGCYHWFESVVLRPSGASSTGTAGAVTETTLVTAPAAHTTASQQQATVGDTVSDTITVTGISQVPAGSSTAGTITATTYFLPASASTGACTAITPARWAAYITAGVAKPVLTDSWPVTADTVLHSRGYRLTAPGCVTWSETYQPQGPSTGSTPPVVLSPPGAPRETTTVVARVVKANAAASTAVLISAGNASTSTPVAWGGVAGGLALMTAGLLLGAGLILRRRHDHGSAAADTTG